MAKGSFWAVPVIHPAYTFRQPEMLGPLSAHLSGFVRRLAKGFDPPPLLLSNPPPSRLQWLLRECQQRKLELAVDVECGRYGLLPGYAELRAVGVGADLDQGVGLSWSWPLPPAIRELLRKAFLSSLPKVLCNGRHYDLPVLARYGMPMRGRREDIRDGRRALSSTSHVGLGPQAAIYLYCGPWKEEAKAKEDAKGTVDVTNIPLPKLLVYNAEDCVRTAQIRTHHRRELADPDPDERERLRLLYAQQLRLADVGARMHLNGFPVNERRRRELRRELTALGVKRARRLAEMLRPFCRVKLLERDEKGDKFRGRFFRISATGGVNENDLRALLYKQSARSGINGFELDVPLAEQCWTETGMPAVNKDALLFLFALDNTPEELKQILRQCWQVDSPLKARSTYIDSEKVLSAIGPDGRLHAGINTVGTETGRWSCRDPNLFNLSEEQKDDEGSLRGDLPNIRSMYEAPPGYEVVHRDYDQLELQNMADYTGDRLLAEMLQTKDVHTTRARLWFNIPEPEPVPQMVRRQGKVVGFCSQYGGGVDMVFLKVLEQIQDARFEEVAALHALFPVKHVGIARHWKKSQEYASLHGYNETPIMRRRRYYPPGAPIKPTETSNYAIQGGAADIANCAMVGLRPEDWAQSIDAQLRKFPKAWLAMHTYDSFDVIAPKAQTRDVEEMLDECMRGPWKIGERERPFTSKAKVGHTWGDV